MRTLFMVIDTASDANELYSIVGRPTGETSEGVVDLVDTVEFTWPLAETEVPDGASFKRRSSPFQATVYGPEQLSAELSYLPDQDAIQVALIDELDGSVEALFEAPVSVPDTV